MTPIHIQIQSVVFMKSYKQIKLQVNKGDTLKREGRLLKSLTRMQRPITVAILQCSTVGVNVTLNKKKSSFIQQNFKCNIIKGKIV